MNLKFSECAGCKRTIFFAVTKKNRKPMPVDAVPVAPNPPSEPGGTFTLEPNDDPSDEKPVAVFVSPQALGTRALYKSHFATCPVVEKFRASRTGGQTPTEQALARLEMQRAEIEADRLAEELIALTKAKVGHWPIYLECRQEWPEFCANHRNVDKRVLKLVAEACGRKLHPKEAQMHADAQAKRFIPSEARHP